MSRPGALMDAAYAASCASSLSSRSRMAAVSDHRPGHLERCGDLGGPLIDTLLILHARGAYVEPEYIGGHIAS